MAVTPAALTRAAGVAAAVAGGLFFGVPNGIAMIGLGYSLWRTTRTDTTAQPSAVTIPAAAAP